MDIYKINYIDSTLLRESKQDDINLINCMITKATTLNEVMKLA